MGKQAGSQLVGQGFRSSLGVCMPARPPGTKCQSSHSEAPTGEARVVKVVDVGVEVAAAGHQVLNLLVDQAVGAQHLGAGQGRQGGQVREQGLQATGD